ncbi:hypothetical protein EI983_17415 [Roseovarius faecimaris]|uniref:Uncharacterized protein n=1 Tax=Roseovarius faecimaris TaxID=2494550 RepID=A0A6I6IRY7_9RHOB|nr:hypothetical protein [Roseovarius faecimaris]QGX99950.1 hypothetical protein EI983_17415 [Roseovarius faecimaris]
MAPADFSFEAVRGGFKVTDRVSGSWCRPILSYGSDRQTVFEFSILPGSGLPPLIGTFLEEVRPIAPDDPRCPAAFQDRLAAAPEDQRWCFELALTDFRTDADSIDVQHSGAVRNMFVFFYNAMLLAFRIQSEETAKRNLSPEMYDKKKLLDAENPPASPKFLNFRPQQLDPEFWFTALNREDGLYVWAP